MRFLPILALSLFTLFTLPGCSGKRLPENCYLPPESGKCRAAITRWYVDERSHACKAFIWGGCEGVVPFETLEDCQAQCMAGQPLPDVVPGVKNPPANNGASTP